VLAFIHIHNILFLWHLSLDMGSMRQYGTGSVRSEPLTPSRLWCHEKECDEGGVKIYNRFQLDALILAVRDLKSTNQALTPRPE